jgi:NADH-quinone oxidoreductase subunit L
MIDLIYLSVLLPLAGFLINGIFGTKIKNEKEYSVQKLKMKK